MGFTPATTGFHNTKVAMDQLTEKKTAPIYSKNNSAYLSNAYYSQQNPAFWSNTYEFPPVDRH